MFKRRGGLKLGPVKINKKSVTIGSGKLKVNLNAKGAQTSVRVAGRTFVTDRKAVRKGAGGKPVSIPGPASWFARPPHLRFLARKSWKALLLDVFGLMLGVIGGMAACVNPVVCGVLFMLTAVLVAYANVTEKQFLESTQAPNTDDVIHDVEGLIDDSDDQNEREADAAPAYDA